VGVGVGVAAGGGVSVGAGVSIGFGVSVVATTGFGFRDGARSLHAAREAVMATAVRMFVKRTELDIGNGSFHAGEIAADVPAPIAACARRFVAARTAGAARRCGM
jgi:hypothetical protein